MRATLLDGEPVFLAEGVAWPEAAPDPPGPSRAPAGEPDAPPRVE